MWFESIPSHLDSGQRPIQRVVVVAGYLGNEEWEDVQLLWKLRRYA